jgi:DNA-binding HxlR family transcriptional regulator
VGAKAKADDDMGLLAVMRKDYGQFCPVALASEVLAERWTLLVIRELLAGSRRFNEIRRGVPGMSATLLKQRLETLEQAGILAQRSDESGHRNEYCLTKAGQELKTVIHGLGVWGQRWARDIRPEDLDPGWLVWNIHRRLNTEVMPPGRTVIEVDFTDAPANQSRFWLVQSGRSVEVCLSDPGWDVSVRISTTVRTLAEVWRGLRAIKDEILAGRLRLEGAPSLCRKVPNWLKLSAYADIPREGRVTE